MYTKVKSYILSLPPYQERIQHNKIFLFWKKKIGTGETMLLALVNVMYHTLLGEHSKDTLIEEGVPYWVKMAVFDLI